ncbi:MAG: hypothetical protein JWM11_1065, partial [Planctomycetaceae bacterium]|nr:hypothetical protein [Planctomycetaceae bacterium]
DNLTRSCSRKTLGEFREIRDRALRNGAFHGRKFEGKRGAVSAATLVRDWS